MRAVWSFWSKPYFAQQGSTWLSHTHYLYSWALSFECARQHFDETVLYTDDAGAELLIEGLKLPFSKVSTSLNDIEHYDSVWWAVGKLYTYSIQSRPFIHIDSDVYLWKALPKHFQRATVIGQNPEYFQIGSSWYQPEKFDAIIESRHWLPDEVMWYRKQGKNQMAVCCGVLGGSDTDFIHHYASQALKLINYSLTEEKYQPLYGDNLLIEQYLLSAFINYKQNHMSGNLTQCKSAYVFKSASEAFNPVNSKRVGYTHLIGGAKHSQELMNRLARRVWNDYPDHFERINAIAI
jgi:hypothetical protein